jgi:hypothetical protein
MRHFDARTEMAFERFATWTAIVASLVGLVALFWVWLQNVRSEDQLNETVAAATRIENDNKTLTSELEGLNARTQAVGEYIADQLKAKERLQLAMAEVLARAKILEQQKSHFESVRQEVADRLHQMDEQYSRAKQFSGQVEPR